MTLDCAFDLPGLDPDEPVLFTLTPKAAAYLDRAAMGLAGPRRPSSPPR